MKLSIITINYNNLEGLRRTYDSIICQTWTDFEWLVIDGGSTDGSKEFIKEHQALIAYWCSEPDNGVYDAMNKGIEIAKGDYLNFMNSGDSFFDCDTLKNVFCYCNGSSVIYGDWIEVFQNRQMKSGIPIQRLYPELLMRNLCHQALFIKRNLLCAEKYDYEKYGLIADWGSITKLILQGNSVEYVPVTVCLYDKTGLTSKKGLDLEREYHAVMSEYPTSIRSALFELYGYQHNTNVQLLKTLEKNAFLKIIVSGILRLLCIF